MNLRKRGFSEKSVIDETNGFVYSVSQAIQDSTDRSRWHLVNRDGRQSWKYMEPGYQQTVGERYFLGLPTGLPAVKPANTAHEAALNGLRFFGSLQHSDQGNWGCEYGGPMFLIPGFIITWYVTGTRIPSEYCIELRRYLFARQNPQDGGWGLHSEGESTVLGSALNYTALRLLGISADDARLEQAHSTLIKLGGILYAPHWGKFWLAVLGVVDWQIVNPAPPELWLLPDWIPIAPWRWWVHMRQVFLPMSYIWSKRWHGPITPLVESLRDELLIDKSYAQINWSMYRNSISPVDNYNPKSWLLNTLNYIIASVWTPPIRLGYFSPLVRWAEDWTLQLICMEDDNTEYANLGPVNAPMNMIARYIAEGEEADSVLRHEQMLHEFLWINEEGMMVNGTNGVQTWDTSLAVQAIIEAGLLWDEQGNRIKWVENILVKALKFLDAQQIRQECPNRKICYRHVRQGAWAFSNRIQGYTVSDCTGEGLKAVLMAQKALDMTMLEKRRLEESVDVLLTMQNQDTGGCSSYEIRRGGKWLELLNAAEVFGKIMVEYDYVECTSTVILALREFQRSSGNGDYRRDDIDRFIKKAVNFVKQAQRDDGGWYGSWGVCFTYGAMFALEMLAGEGEDYSNSHFVRKGCDFLLQRQREDGGWGESWVSCERVDYIEATDSQVVQTAMAVIGLLCSKCTDKMAIKRGIELIMKRQTDLGEWRSEAIEGVFNRSCMIRYPNYKFIFCIKALGMFEKVKNRNAE